MRNQRIFVKHSAAVNRGARREILLKGTQATLLTVPLYPRTGNVAFIVAGNRYEMPLEDFMDTTVDLHGPEPFLTARENGTAAISAA
jgi:hypothetical protein